ncbi:hypothetical protein PYCCODRAFT_1472356 [Trametes coccinea BRFM310]|uniref:Uncharacterized protein n=1 Tax=Trametes coccinea (strain BRFM310) TaxID=1353009 RepID=A0A1Y2I6K7_TRAC3|nr:hypothetical protein PYCCODRAFT_1472356 [Trametes coccinea BRFM310]
MAGPAVLNPIRIHPLASSSSSHSSSFVSLADDWLWDCDLLQPPSRATSTALSVLASSSQPAALRIVSPSCDVQQRLMNLLNFTTEPSSTSPPQAATTSYDPFAPFTPASPTQHRPTHPAPPRAGTSVLSPLMPAQVHKITISFPSHPSPLPAMSYVAPVPRLPLADVLRHLDTSWASRTPDASTRAPTANPHAVSPRGSEHPQSRLGLVLGSASLPIHLPHPHLELDAISESPSRYSRRLRNIAPAPLRLASSTPRTPLRAFTQPQTPVTSIGGLTPASSVFVDIPLATANSPNVFQCNTSVSPQSDRRASVTSTMASHSTAPTSPSYHANQENAHPKRSANPTYIDGLSSRQFSSWSRESPLSPLAPKQGDIGPSTLGKGWNTPHTPAASSRRTNLDYAAPFTPGLPADAPPLPLRRTEWVPLPDLADAESPSPDIEALSPLRADLRLDLGVEDLSLRAEKCSETIACASMYLCSCSLLREPELIVNLCEKLRATFASVQRALDGTPSESHADGSDVKRTWYAKHWQIISSLDRNLNMFYLLAHQVEKRLPRIHRLAPTLDKLGTYQAKFADLARWIALSHEKLHFHGLRAQLSTIHAYA